MKKKITKKCQLCGTTKDHDVKVYYVVDGNGSSTRFFCTPCFIKFNKQQYDAHKSYEQDYDTKS
jgi:hypothetical protein